MAEAQAQFIIGWEEWVALPSLGLPAIKAKVDTGARTSALHAFLIEPFGPIEQPMVRFGVHPVPGRNDIEIFCSAPIVGRREVTSSNGERDTRYFIIAEVAMGDRIWPIEISLTNRDSMAYRMLLGRQAIREDMMVDPAASFLQPRLGYRLYRQLPRRDPVARTLRIAVLSRAATAPTNHALRLAAEARGHVLECLQPDRLSLTFDDLVPGLACEGEAIPHYDAVIPRIGLDDGPHGAAVVRQLQMMGGYAVNPGDAIDRRANRLAMVQALANAGVRSTNAANPDALLRPAAKASRRPGPALRLLVIGGRVAAAIPHGGHRRAVPDPSDVTARRLRAASRVAERAAEALDLGLCGVDLRRTNASWSVSGISIRPALTRYQSVGAADLAGAVIDLVEARARSWVRREETGLANASAGLDQGPDPADDTPSDQAGFEGA